LFSSSPIKTLFSDGVFVITDTTADFLLVKLEGLMEDDDDGMVVAVKVLLASCGVLFDIVCIICPAIVAPSLLSFSCCSSIEKAELIGDNTNIECVNNSAIPMPIHDLITSFISKPSFLLPFHLITKMVIFILIDNS
jgi:hypothetical protein